MNKTVEEINAVAKNILGNRIYENMEALAKFWLMRDRVLGVLEPGTGFWHEIDNLAKKSVESEYGTLAKGVTFAACQHFPDGIPVDAKCSYCLADPLSEASVVTEVDYENKSMPCDIEPDSVSPAETGWTGDDGTRHYPDYDDQGNRKTTPDTAGKNDLIAEAGHEPVSSCNSRNKSLEKKEMGYRDLEVGETILDGDEYFDKVINEWDTAVATIGKPVTEARFGNYRRPIPDDTPSLSLLVVDFGDAVCLKVEHSDRTRWLELGTMKDKRVGLGDGTAPHLNAKIFHILFEPFDKIRSAIDALGEDEKPRNRLEHRGNDTIMFYYNGCSTYITQSQYDALCEIAGKDLPIYQPRGQWTQLPGEVKAWRFTCTG